MLIQNAAIIIPSNICFVKVAMQHQYKNTFLLFLSVLDVIAIAIYSISLCGRIPFIPISFIHFLCQGYQC